MFNLDRFIADHVTMRPSSMFAGDIEANAEKLREAIEGKKVLVIGGAGSIGSSFIRALLPFNPASLVVADTNENALAELTRDIRSRGLPVPADYRPYPMDYASEPFKQMFAANGGFDIVGNFSAHKHVRSEKDIYSVQALLNNNVFGARRLLKQLADCPPERYFCVSTDKAANPVNIMGASKRIMEDLIFSESERVPVRTARFTNVAFSNGSLPDGFMHRLAKLQPLTAPTDVRRYFVSPEESGQICLLACMLGNNREIFFPKLDEVQMKTFDEIAVALLKEYGFEPLPCGSDEEAVKEAAILREELSRTESSSVSESAGSKETVIQGNTTSQASATIAALPKYPVHFFISDTSGEKPFEEFYIEGEDLDMERFAALGVITGKPVPDKKALTAFLDDLEDAVMKRACTKEDTVRMIGSYLPNFAHIETGKGLDSKM